MVVCVFGCGIGRNRGLVEPCGSVELEMEEVSKARRYKSVVVEGEKRRVPVFKDSGSLLVGKKKG